MVVMRKGCVIEGCSGKYAGRGLCNKHWARWKRHGDPLAGNTCYRTPEESFLARTKWVGECLIWTGSKNLKGYGDIWNGEKVVRAHRYAWEQKYGPIPEGKVIDHTCYKTECCNVNHLRIATNSENQRNRSGAQRSNRSSGVRNVYNRGGRWQVRIGKGGKIYNFGVHDTIEEAAIIAAQKRKELFGDFAGKG